MRTRGARDEPSPQICMAFKASDLSEVLFVAATIAGRPVQMCVPEVTSERLCKPLAPIFPPPVLSKGP